MQPEDDTIEQNDATEQADDLSENRESQAYKSDDGEQTVAGQQE